ncbi:L-threonylcarbamoyladenylate synthase [Leptolyngbya sp. FACHB-17]|uniref:L-threonylcarbamoyladenylate synthase n=1 Tax=unclassified Leptolyngbya TaxID=2650499 RepID=UPI00167FE947|nr:L-threonylcarbamoyladenylate synthase [Leptolyngbya sp. FACHB-17]MBD2080221.1 threonylcarbamoyl-AMP synthase [Leptolyngbya sp. FACHB-17]
MATLYKIHPDTPQSRSVDQVVSELRNGAVMLYPTDTVYAIGCDLNSKSGVQRVRQLKQLANEKPLTFLCSSLSDISQYAVVGDRAYRIMRSLVPGSYTFLLPATKLVPKLVMNPKRKTTGIRVPDHSVCQALLKSLGNPIISTSAHVPVEDETIPLKVRNPENLALPELFDSMDRLVDLIVDTGQEPTQAVSTILDLTADEPEIVRKGLGWEAAADWVLE